MSENDGSISAEVTARRCDSQALSESEAKYRTLFESIDEGFCIVEVLVDSNNTPVDYRVLEINPIFEQQTGIQQAVGKTARQLNLEAHWIELYGRVALTGEPIRFENGSDTLNRWFDVYACCIGQPQDCKVAIVFKDISERKRREANLAFLAEVAHDFSRLSIADEVMQTVGAKIGDYLQITTCNFTDVDEAHDQVTVHYGWSSPTVPSTVGTFRLSQYLSQEFERSCRAGETVIVCNTQTDPRTDAAGYAALNTYSFVTVPFHNNGRWTHYIAICDSRPRHWRTDEIELIVEISNRIFPWLERARAEAAVRAADVRLRAMTDTAPVLIWETDETGMIFLNRYYLDFFGVSFETVREMGWTQFMHPEDATDYETAWREALKRGQPYTYDCRFRRADGEYRWLRNTGRPVDKNRVVGCSLDITERKQAEEISRRAAEIDAFRVKLSDGLRSLTDSSEIQATAARILGEALGATRVIYVEVVAEGKEVLVHRNYTNGVAELSGRYRLEDYRRNLWIDHQSGQTQVVTNIPNNPHYTPAEKTRYREIEIAAHIDVPLLKNNEFVALLAVHQSTPRSWTENEIHLVEETAERTWAAVERARVEAEVAADLRDTQLLRELGARLVTEDDRQMLYQEIVSAAIALTHADAGTIQILNEATQDLMLLATQGLEPTFVEHFHRVDASSSTSCGRALMSGDRVLIDFNQPETEDFDSSLQLHVEAGYRSAQSTPLITRAGRAIGMVSTHWREHHRPSDRELRFLDLLVRQAADLIERRQTEAALQAATAEAQQRAQEAQQANRIKDEFLAVLSHELRSPLNPILGWAKLLQQGRLDAAKTQQAIQTIERNAQLQSELIEDLLDVSRILQGKLSLTVNQVNLATVIRAAMETVRLAAEAKGIEVKSEAIEPLQIMGDATRLQQVVLNLLSNAVKFTPPGGRVEVRLAQVDHQAQITVTDTGKGIAPDFLPHVFDYFQQEDGATTRKFGGLGLGLAIVKQIVELHGGTVAAESQGEGQGATFTVKLPLLRNRESEVGSWEDLDAPFSTPHSPLTGLRVLVVNDDTDSRDFIAFAIEQAGATVSTAASGAAAIAILMQSQLDVLVSDVGMPEMDGYMLMRQVRSLPPEQNGQVKAGASLLLKAIALTAYAGDFNQQQARQAGFQQHLSKPVEPEKLVQAIAHLCGRNSFTEGRGT